VHASPLLPDTLLKSIKADPSGYLESVATMIASYGAADGITEVQVDTSLALLRAKARSGAIMPLIGADLDADGTVTRDEVMVAEAAASAAARGRLERAFQAADADGNAMVTPAELTDFGMGAAMAALSPAEMARIKVLMGFDADGDGKVTVNEVRAGLVGLTS
jgi:hypothetical protein